jgi:hypothetical protein
MMNMKRTTIFLLKKTLQYLERVGIALSVLINVILGGPSNQTFSARNYSRKKQNRFHLVWLIDFLIFWDKDHCLHSWLYWYTGKNIRKYGKKYLQQYEIEVQSTVIKGDNDYANFD